MTLRFRNNTFIFIGGNDKVKEINDYLLDNSDTLYLTDNDIKSEIWSTVKLYLNKQDKMVGYLLGNDRGYGQSMVFGDDYDNFVKSLAMLRSIRVSKL